MDRIAICEVFYMLEADFHDLGGGLWERPSNQRRRMSTGAQLHRMGFRPSPLLAFVTLDEEQRDLYYTLAHEWNLPVVESISVALHADNLFDSTDGINVTASI